MYMYEGVGRVQNYLYFNYLETGTNKTKDKTTDFTVTVNIFDKFKRLSKAEQTRQNLSRLKVKEKPTSSY